MPLLIVNYVFTLLVAKLPILSFEKQPSLNSYASHCNNPPLLPFSSRLGTLRWLHNFWHATKWLQQNVQKTLIVLMGVIV